jgi:hypothetical protein
MEKQDIKRGVDFETRVGETAMQISQAFLWWRGGRLNQRTLFFLALVWILNFIIVFPIFGKNLTQAYSSSTFLVLISEFFHRFLNLPQHFFFSILTFFSFTFAPVSFYLFVRKIAMRHEITALIATLLFILPNPFFNNVPILVAAILRGDGAHVLAISFIPFFLLYVQTFISTGAPVLFFMTAIGIAYIAIISPFAVFNLVLCFGVLTIAEGFQGNLRIKLIRAFILLLTASALAFFWYYPSMILKIVALSHIQYTITKFLGILPAAIPVVPVAGALSFLIFDRREKLKPIFVSLSLFFIYLTFYGVSSQLEISGIFTADRYLPELTMFSSFFLAILFILLVELIIRHLLPKLKGKIAFFGFIFLITFGTALVGFLTFQGIGIVHIYIQSEQIVDHYNEGVGTLRGFIDWRDFTSIFAGIVSMLTFLFLIYILRRYPTSLRRGVQK